MCVLHTAENTPDTVATDGGAEAVANFIRGRADPGSYHDLVDSDSGIQLVRYDCEAFQDGTGSNAHAWGGSVATRADFWPLAPKAWRDGAIHQLAAAAARYAHWIKATHGITVPARRITRAESERRMPGFISHAERDPTRRTDPGKAFPWNQFLAEYALLADRPQPPATPRPKTTPAGSGTRLLKRGTRGSDVAAWQTILQGAGHNIAADGIFGPATETATKTFQRALGVTPDGIVGPQTRDATGRLFRYLAALKDRTKAKAPPYPGLVKRGDRGPAVRAVQQRLRDRGWRITVDGIYGPKTETVVIAFQREKGLTVDGIAGPQTWRALWTAPIT